MVSFLKAIFKKTKFKERNKKNLKLLFQFLERKKNKKKNLIREPSYFKLYFFFFTSFQLNFAPTLCLLNFSVDFYKIQHNFIMNFLSSH